LSSQPVRQVHGQTQKSRDQEQGEDSGDHQSTDYDTSQSPVELGPSAGEEDEGQHANGAGDHGHEDGPDAAIDGLAYSQSGFDVGIGSADIESLVYDQDGGVNDHANQDDESEHGQDVECLVADEEVDGGEAEDAPGRGGGDAEHDDERVQEALEQRGHEQVGDDQGQQQVPLQSLSRLF